MMLLDWLASFSVSLNEDEKPESAIDVFIGVDVRNVDGDGSVVCDVVLCVVSVVDIAENVNVKGMESMS